MKNQAKNITFNNRMFFVLVFLFALISARLIYVANSSVVDKTNMKEFIANRNIKKTIMYANRGLILDAFGEKLSHNVNSYTVIAYLDASRTTNLNNPKHVVDKEKTAEALEDKINMSKEDILKILNRNVTNPDIKQVELGPGGRDITELTKQSIEALALPGIDFIKGLKREYPNGQFASYILGYVKKDDNGEMFGEMGIEKFYNDELKGSDGYKEFQKDIYGYQIADTPYVEIPAKSGHDIYLTIDSNVQIFLENALDSLVEKHSPEWGILTVMDAKTGAIVGSATSPTFNPKTKNIVNYNNPLTSYTFEPGSTMKIFSYMAAMEKGVYDGQEKYKSGTIVVKDSTIKDHNTVGWGTITYDQGFTYSSNVAATLLAQKVGKDYLTDYYKKLGFGKKTEIELSGELSGKINFKYDVELANAGFGQGITVTPVQMLQAMTAVTNSGVMLKPYIIDKIVDPNTNKVVYQSKKTEIANVASKETINHIIELLDETVNGSANDITARGFKTDSVTVIGKTGTAQVVGKNGKYLTGKYDYIRSFIGAFPKENPKYIVYIATNKLVGYNSNLGTTVKEIVENISKNKYLSDTDVISNKDNQYTMPQLNNKNIVNAIETIDKLTKKYVVLGDGDYVIDQYPKEKTKMHDNNLVLILTNYKLMKMPDAIGWSSTEINNYCNIIKLNCKLNDIGYVTQTSVKTDEIIDFKNTLIVDLKTK